MKILLPNKQTYNVSQKILNAAKQLAEMEGWEINGQDVYLFHLPIGTKFHRSASKKREDDGKYLIKVTTPKPDKKTFYISLDTPLKHTLTIGPSLKNLNDPAQDRDTRVLYELQHGYKNYLHYYWLGINNNSRVKLGIPLFNLGKKEAYTNDDILADKQEAIVYKTEKSVRTFSTVPRKLGFTLWKSHKEVTFMPYKGPNLRYYFTKNTLSREKVIGIATQCCQLIHERHLEDLCLNDIAPDNFTYSESEDRVFIIDEAGINKSSINESRIYRDNYAIVDHDSDKDSAKEPSSKTRDAYAFGKTLHDFATRKSNPSLYCLGTLLSQKEPNDRFSIEQTLLWLQLSKQSETLVNALAIYYFTSPASKKDKADKIKALLLFIQTKQQSTVALSVFELEAIGYLFQYAPTLSIPKNWEKLFHPEQGPLLTCILLGAGEYLTHATLLKSHGKNAVKQLFNDILSDTSGNQITADKINTLISKTTAASEKSHENGMRWKKSGTNNHSRQTIFEKYQAIAAKATGTQDTALDESKKNLLIKFTKLFPKYHLAWEAIIKPENKLLASIITKSIEYLEKHKQHANTHGKKSVRQLAETLLKGALDNEKKTENTHETDLKSEVKACCYGLKSEYKLFGTFKMPSSDKTGSRADIFKELLPEVRVEPGYVHKVL